LQKRSSISLPRYLLAGLAAFAAGCGGGDEEPSGPIPVDRDPIAHKEYAKPLGAALELEHALEDDAYRARLITRFTSITPENAMKWANVQPERGEFDFEEADELVEFARRTGKRVRGHPLVWDSQLPAWVEEGDWSPRELRRVLRDHVRALAGRYRGKIDEWDVVNEPLAKDGSLEQNVWHRTLGPRWIAYAFRVAHRVDPEARLFLNEFNAERAGRKSRALLALARGLKELGVPIDGVGFQLHATGQGAPSRDRLDRLFRATARSGLSMAITELDVRNAGEARQARIYRDAARACAHAANCTGITIWGVTDRWSWLTPASRALPYDVDGRPKPALRALIAPLRR
jgi:endo-1,4-beta-xylanase